MGVEADAVEEVVVSLCDMIESVVFPDHLRASLLLGNRTDPFAIPPTFICLLFQPLEDLFPR